MRNTRLFWGLFLLLIGALLLLQNMGILSFSIWGVIWPAFLILLGIQFLGGFSFGQRNQETTQLSIPLEGATESTISFNHGAGRLFVTGGAASDTLVAGTFDGGVVQDVQQNGSNKRIRLSASADNFFFAPFGANRYGYSWNCSLNQEVPLSLEFHTGASESDIDLSNLKVTYLRLETGASSNRLTAPANAGLTRASISAGAASLDIRIPDGVAAHIRVKSGLSGINIDQNRFPKGMDGYESMDYAGAANRIDVDIEAGVGSISVH